MFEITFVGATSSGNSCFISDGGTGVLIDAGISLKDTRSLIDVLKIDAIFLTHEHADHVKYIDQFVPLQIPIYSTFGTFSKVPAVPEYAKVVLETLKPKKIKTLTILPFTTYHDAEEPIGLLIANKKGQRFVFVSDTGTMDRMFIEADIYCLECNYTDTYIRALKEQGKIEETVFNRLTSAYGHMSSEDIIPYVLHNLHPDKHKVIFHHTGKLGNRDRLFEPLHEFDFKVAEKGMVLRYD